MNNESSGPRQTYLIGSVVGAIFGLFAAYLFVRAADEDSLNGEPPHISTAAMIGVGLSALSLARQIAEAGRPKK